MTKDTKKNMMPKLLRFAPIKSGMEMGAWFGAAMITHTVIMGAFEFGVNAFRTWRWKKDQAKRMAEFEAQMQAAIANKDEEVPAEDERPVAEEVADAA